MKTKTINSKKLKKECDGADVGGGEASAAGAISSGDVLGNCEHSGNDFNGYLDADCFHIPTQTLPMMKRLEPCYGGSKRKNKKKTPYEKGMKIFGSLKEKTKSRPKYSKHQIEEAIKYWENYLLTETTSKISIDELIRRLTVAKNKAGGDTNIIAVEKNENNQYELVYAIGPGAYAAIPLNIDALS